MGRTTEDQLRDLLRCRAQAVGNETIQAGGQVATEQVEALQRLARLVEICNAAQSLPSRKRWPVATVLGSTLLIVSILLFARVSTTEIELDLTVSEVSFVLPTQQVLTEGISLSALGVSGLREIHLPYTRTHDPRTTSASEDIGSAIRLSVASDGERQGTVTLATLTLPAETRVRLHRTEMPRQYRLSLEGTGLVLSVHVNGSVSIGLSGAPAKQFDFLSPKSILLQPGADEVDVDLLVLPDASQSVFSPQLPASTLSLFRIDEFTGLGGTLVRRVSTVLSGTLYFESLNGEKRPLRPGEALHFAQARGEIRTLQLHDNHIALQFHGHVHGMSSGSDKSHRSLMPTYLEWLRARHGLSLLWGTTLYLFGVIVGALRWWGIRL